MEYWTFRHWFVLLSLLIFTCLMVFGFVTTVPVFNAIGKTFSLDKGTLRDLETAGLSRFEGEIPSGSFVVVGYTCSWWRPPGGVGLAKLSLNLNWVVVLGVPSAV